MEAKRKLCCAFRDSQEQLPEGLLALMPVVRHDIGKMMRQMDRTIKLHSIVESQSTGDECQDNEEEECDT